MQKMNVFSSIGEKIVANIVIMGDVIGEEKRNCNLLLFFGSCHKVIFSLTLVRL
jgi:hypothetical protein